MKIVFFDLVSNFGGSQQLAVDIAKRLSVEHDVEVIDVCGGSEPYVRTLEDAGITVHVLMSKVVPLYIGYPNRKFRRLWLKICRIPFWLRLQRKLIQKVREINPDVIWTNGKLALFLLGFSLRLLRYPLAMEIVTCYDAASIRGCHKWLMKHRVSVLMAISTETAKQLHLAGIKKDNTSVIFDTIDISDTLNRSKQPLETPLPGLDRHPRILVPAFLLHKKGQGTAIRAIARLKSEGFDPVLWLAGTVVMNDQSYLEYLQGLVKELNVLDNVYFLGWREDVPAIMMNADIVVLPTHQEGFGHVVLEAMLLRRPAIATPVGGIKDSIQDGVNGLNFPVGDEHVLADCIKRVVSDGQLVKTLTRNGYITATQTFSPENHTKRFMAGLKFAIQSRSGRKK